MPDGYFDDVSPGEFTRRLRRIAVVTELLAAGQYDERLEAAAPDELGRIEAHLNQVVEHFAELLAREKLLVERNARLEERARLSRDLHDSVKQQVFALAVQIELARSLLDQDRAAAHEHLDAADELTYQVQQELSALIDSLRPADLQAKGLADAIREYVMTWSRQSRIAADLSLPEACPLPPMIEEALSNVARHSRGNLVHLHLQRTEQHVSLCVTDNGHGFEVDAHESDGLGLRSIGERIEQLGGTIRVQSARGAGTSILVHCPLPQRTNDTPPENEVAL